MITKKGEKDKITAKDARRIVESLKDGKNYLLLTFSVIGYTLKITKEKEQFKSSVVKPIEKEGFETVLSDLEFSILLKGENFSDLEIIESKM